VIFDTDVLFWASRGSERATRAIDAAPDRALAIVSLMELLQGARSKLEVRQIQQSLRQLHSKSCRFPKPSGPQPPPSSNSTLSPTVFN
jgi:predicted nucleic acid-binding protein